jgi:hypothetical protein
MKRKILFFVLLHVFLMTICFSQKDYLQGLPENTPEDIENRLLKIKSEIKLKLDSCRINDNVGNWFINYLSWCLNEYPKDLKSKADSLNIVLDWMMVYDDDMIERIIQLLNNEYLKDELETLVNRQMAIFSQNSGFEQDAIWQMKIDTSKVFLMIKDSLNKHRNREIHPELYQNFDVFLYMQLDTTTRFRIVLDSVIKSEREKEKAYYLNKYYFDIKGLIKSCGYIKNKRLIKPLVNLLEKMIERNNELSILITKNENNRDSIGIWYDEKRENGFLIDATETTLVRLKVDPYYSEFIKNHSHSLEEIQKMEFAPYIEYIPDLLQNQEVFLEISKYLYSSAYTAFTSEGPAGKAYQYAYREIKNFIENKELQEIINKPDFDLEKDRFIIYDWMQKNYGKYEIKRLW